MTATILAFRPVDRATAIVDAARAILRNAANHDDATLIEACDALNKWGDPPDWLQADAMMLAIRLRAHHATIRDALVDCAGLAVICAAALAVYLMGGL